MVRHRRPALVATAGWTLAATAGWALTACGTSPGPPPAEPVPTATAPQPGSRPGALGARSRPAPGPAPKARPVVVLDPGHNGGNAGHPAAINTLVRAGGFEKPCNTTG